MKGEANGIVLNASMLQSFYIDATIQAVPLLGLRSDCVSDCVNERVNE